MKARRLTSPSPTQDGITSVMDTAYLSAHYRALESARDTALIDDPYAALLAGEHGAKVAGYLPEQMREMKGIAIRTRVYDALLSRMVNEAGVDTVLNLGCGFDTRPYRLSLPTSLRWIEVDLPDILAYKAEKLVHLKAQCALEQVALDLTNQEASGVFFKRVNREAKRVLVLSEGLLVYLHTEQVVALAKSLHEQEAFHWWVTEFVTPQALRLFEEHWNPYVPETVRMKYVSGPHPQDRQHFFKKFGWRVHEFHIPLEEALKMHVTLPHAWLARSLIALAKLRPDAPQQGNGFALLERV